MTEQELKEAIRDGRIRNTVHKFWTKETIAEAGRKKVCPKVCKLAWKKYVESVKDLPCPEGGGRAKRSDQARIAQSKRKTHSGPAKKLAPCSHCGELLGVRDRRLHGDRGERDRQAEYQRIRTRKDK